MDEHPPPASPSPLLTAESVPAYLREQCNRGSLTVFGASASISAKAIAGGNVNYAFQATDAQSGTSIFVKQAPEYVAIFGPGGFPLSPARMQQEIDLSLIPI